MGAGIAQVFAMNGFAVTVVEVNAEVRRGIRDGGENSLQRMVRKEIVVAAQAAEALDISPATADRDWAYAKAFLYAEIRKARDS